MDNQDAPIDGEQRAANQLNGWMFLILGLLVMAAGAVGGLQFLQAALSSDGWWALAMLPIGASMARFGWRMRRTGRGRLGPDPS